MFEQGYENHFTRDFNGDGFLIAYDDGVSTNIALVTTAAGVADNALWSDAVVTDITMLAGVADATSLTAASWLNFLA